MGFSHKLVLNCVDCKNYNETFTSNECQNDRNVQDRRKFEVNVRAILAFREIGRGHAAMETASRCLNMHSLSEIPFQSIQKELHAAYKEAANDSMQNAVREIKDKLPSDSNQIPKCCVSLDGTWQKRGHSSINGVVTAMSNGKCIDAHVMSKACKICSSMEVKKNDPDFDYDSSLYEHVKLFNECEINHTASSGAMDSSGAVEIFNRSVKKMA